MILFKSRYCFGALFSLVIFASLASIPLSSQAKTSKLTGPYIGANFGAVDYSMVIDRAVDFSGTHKSITGGFSGGYNFWPGKMLLGLKLDVNIANVTAENSIAFATSKVSSFGSGMLLLGLQIENCSLVYLNFGPGFIRYKARFNSATINKTAFAYAVGGGLKYVTDCGLYVDVHINYYNANHAYFPTPESKGEINQNLLVSAIEIGYQF